MREPIFETKVKNLTGRTIVFANHILYPQVTIRMRFYRYSDLKRLQKYVNMNILEAEESPTTSGNVAGGFVDSSIPTNLNTVTEISKQLTFVKPLLVSDFSETGTGTGKWRTVIEHNFGRLPDVKVISNNSIIYGDIVHDNAFNSFTLTLSQRIACTVHCS